MKDIRLLTQAILWVWGSALLIGTGGLAIWAGGAIAIGAIVGLALIVVTILVYNAMVSA